MRRLAKIAKANQSSLTCAAKPPTGLQRQGSGASSTKSEPILQRQGSLMSHLGSSMRRRMSSAGGVMAREEGRAARVYTISLLLLLLTWTPFYTAHCVQVVTEVQNRILSSQGAFVLPQGSRKLILSRKRQK